MIYACPDRENEYLGRSDRLGEIPFHVGMDEITMLVNIIHTYPRYSLGKGYDNPVPSYEGKIMPT